MNRDKLFIPIELLQVTFIALVIFIYACTFFLLWSGFYPTDSIQEFTQEYEVFLPWLTSFAVPILLILFFLINRDPKTEICSRFRTFCINVMTDEITLSLACVFSFQVLIVVSILLINCLSYPQNDSFKSFIEGRIDSHDYESKDTCVNLAIRSVIEARQSTKKRKSFKKVNEIKEKVKLFDKSLKPLWCRSIANYSLGNIYFCKGDSTECEKRFQKARTIASNWLLNPNWLKVISKAEAQSLVELSRNVEANEQKTLLQLVRQITKKYSNKNCFDFMEGECFFIEKNYPNAIKTWNSLLEGIDTKTEAIDGVLVKDIRKRKIQAERQIKLAKVNLKKDIKKTSKSGSVKLGTIAKRMREQFEKANKDWHVSRTEWRLKDKYVESIESLLDEALEECANFEEFFEYCRKHQNEAFAISLSKMYKTLDVNEKKILGFYLFRTLFLLEEDHRAKSNEFEARLNDPKSLLSKKEKARIKHKADLEGNLGKYLRGKAIKLFQNNIHWWLMDSSHSKCAAAYGAHFCDVLITSTAASESEYSSCINLYCDALVNASQNGLLDDCPEIFETSRRKAWEILVTVEKLVNSQSFDNTISKIEKIEINVDRQPSYIMNPASACTE